MAGEILLSTNPNLLPMTKGRADESSALSFYGHIKRKSVTTKTAILTANGNISVF
jgi:hypothetical protein